MNLSTINSLVIRKSSVDLEIHLSNLPTDCQVSLYWSLEPNIKQAHKLLITHHVEPIIHFTDPYAAQRRVYFILEWGHQLFIFSERTLPIEGLNNFRDFGGYLAVEGKRVKWGCLYRSNQLNHLTPAALKYIKELNIRTIIDYRSANEIAKYPNCDIGEDKTYHLDATAQTAELAAQFAADPSHEDAALIESVMQHIPKEMINGSGEQIHEQYRHFVISEKSKTAFRAMIRLLLEEKNSPSIQHCRGGKDRTGYGVFLILAMLGVSQRDIIDDYMLTHHNRLARNVIKMAAYQSLTDDQDILDYLLTLIDTRESFILASINSMIQLSGSVNDYIKDELGFTDNDFSIIRAIYLEENLAISSK